MFEFFFFAAAAAKKTAAADPGILQLVAAFFKAIKWEMVGFNGYTVYLFCQITANLLYVIIPVYAFMVWIRGFRLRILEYPSNETASESVVKAANWLDWYENATQDLKDNFGSLYSRAGRCTLMGFFGTAIGIIVMLYDMKAAPGGLQVQGLWHVFITTALGLFFKGILLWRLEAKFDKNLELIKQKFRSVVAEHRLGFIQLKHGAEALKDVVQSNADLVAQIKSVVQNGANEKANA